MKIIFIQIRDQNRTVDGINRDIAGLQEERDYVKKNSHGKHKKKVLKELRRRIDRLTMLRKTAYVPRTEPYVRRDRWGIEIPEKPQKIEAPPDEPGYIYKGESKPKTGRRGKTVTEPPHFLITTFKCLSCGHEFDEKVYDGAPNYSCPSCGAGHDKITDIGDY